MKRGTSDHPKMQLLAELLDELLPDTPYWIRCHVAAASLDRLWEWAAQFTPQGDVGRWPDCNIARGARFEGDSSKFVSMLVQAGWLDKGPEGRLVIHDWADHCELSVHTFLAKKRLRFTTGEVPRLDGLNSGERAQAAEFYANEADPQGQQNQPVTERQNPPESAMASHGTPRQATAKSGPPWPAMVTDTDTDTNTDTNADTEEIRPGTGPSLGGPPASRGRNGPTSASASVSANTHQTRTPRGRDRGGPPQPLAQILGSAPTASAEDYAAQIVELTVEGQEYRAWWLETIRRMERTGGLGVLDEGVRYVRDCADPATRQAKDLGELRNPGAYLARRCRDWLHRHGRRLPAAPQAAEASG